jgi:hypothetical protein
MLIKLLLKNRARVHPFAGNRGHGREADLEQNIVSNQCFPQRFVTLGVRVTTSPTQSTLRIGSSTSSVE